MNNVQLTGRLTRDAELLETNKSERKAIKFTLAVQRIFKNSSDGKNADFIPVVYFTNYADKLIQYLTKGKPISVSGKIRVQSIEGKNNKKKYFTDIQADNIDFLGSNSSKVV